RIEPFDAVEIGGHHLDARKSPRRDDAGQVGRVERGEVGHRRGAGVGSANGSIASPAAKRGASLPIGPSSSMPTGRPAPVRPMGRARPGRPATLPGPVLRATVGKVGTVAPLSMVVASSP